MGSSGGRPFDQLRDRGLAASKSRGQNFLRDPSLSLKIARLIMAEKPEGASVLEIGPGLGAITRPLIGLGANVTAVELDRGLANALSAWAEAQGGALRVVLGDVLGMDPAGLGEPGRAIVAGNLPYNISSRLLFWFLENFLGSKGVFMLQKELAARLASAPGGRDYGRLTVGLAPWYSVSAAFDVGPGAFQPRPKVTSTVVVLRPRIDPPTMAPKELSAFTLLCFHSRRKTIFNNLAPAYGKERTQGILAGLGIAPGARPETLSPSQYVAMAKAFGTP